MYLHSHKNTVKHVSYIEIRGIINEPTQISVRRSRRRGIKKNVLNTIKTIFRPGGKKRRIPEIITLHGCCSLQKEVKKETREKEIRCKGPRRKKKSEAEDEEEVDEVVSVIPLLKSAYYCPRKREYS